MIRQIGSKLLVAAALVIAIAAPAAAQGTSESTTVGGGLVVNHWFNLDSSSIGINVDFHKPLAQHGFAAVADFSVAWDGDVTDSSFGGGIRCNLLKGGKVGAYGQVTLGLVHQGFEGGFGDSAFYIAPGGGVTYDVTSRVAIKAQVDFLLNSGWDFDDGHIFRFIVGANFAIGK